MRTKPGTSQTQLSKMLSKDGFQPDKTFHGGGWEEDIERREQRAKRCTPECITVHRVGLNCSAGPVGLDDRVVFTDAELMGLGTAVSPKLARRSTGLRVGPLTVNAKMRSPGVPALVKVVAYLQRGNVFFNVRAGDCFTYRKHGKGGSNIKAGEQTGERNDFSKSRT